MAVNSPLSPEDYLDRVRAVSPLVQQIHSLWLSETHGGRKPILRQAYVLLHADERARSVSHAGQVAQHLERLVGAIPDCDRSGAGIKARIAPMIASLRAIEHPSSA
jgi:hypothetical protein